MLLVACDSIRRAHYVGVELAAMAVVVAHFGGVGEGAVGGPIERRLNRDVGVARFETKQTSIVLHTRSHDLTGIHQIQRIEQALHLRQRRGQARPEERRDPFAAHQAVAVLAGIHAFVFAHQFACLFGNGAHFVRAILLHVENRANVQGADAGVGVPGAAGAVFLEYRRKPLRVVGEMFQRYAAILDEAHRLAIALHAHHDIEAGFAHVPQGFLPMGIGEFDKRIRQPKIG